MTFNRQSGLDKARAFYARMMASVANSDDERLERIFEIVPREAFLGPGPWEIIVNRHFLETPSDDPAYLYQNVLVVLDGAKGINNGEPFLHAAWIGLAAPQAGETIIHVGAGTGYYTALLSMLVLPNGHVYAYEIEEDLAKRAQENLKPFLGITLIHGDATTMVLPSSDLIYVNAGVIAPPLSWLKSLRPGGRLIFPWQVNPLAGLTLLLTRSKIGFAARPLMQVAFIPCIGASDPEDSISLPSMAEAYTIRSAWLTSDYPPDESAVAIFRRVWFSNAGLEREIHL